VANLAVASGRQEAKREALRSEHRSVQRERKADMIQAEFIDFARAACARAVEMPDCIGYLRLTKHYREEAGEWKIREPELCQALIDEARDRRIYYGLEVPTDSAYRFTPVLATGSERPYTTSSCSGRFVRMRRRPSAWS
jgi:hypothetical protein